MIFVHLYSLFCNIFSLLKAAGEVNFESRLVDDAKAMLSRGANLSQVMGVLKNGKDSVAIVSAIEAAINFGMDKNDPVIESARVRLAGLSANTARSQDVSWQFYLL